MISVVIPCYNREQYLGEALSSIRRQTRPVDEVIVVDDCSTDGSQSVARRFGAVVLQTPNNSGPALARNIGAEAAKGDLIAWLDADDYWDPNHLEVVAGLLDTFPDAAVAFSAVRLVGSRASEGPWRYPSSGKPESVFWDCLKGTIVPGMSPVTRREAYLGVGGSDPDIRVAPDFDLWLRLSRHHLFVNTQEVTSNYRWHGDQISSAPDAQLRSVYASRWRYLQSSRSAGDEDFSKTLASRMAEIWDCDLFNAMSARDLAQVRTLLSLRRLVPRDRPVRRLLRWRKLVAKKVADKLARS